VVIKETVTFTCPALPAAYVELVDLHAPSIEEMWQIIRKSDGGEAMMMRPEYLVIKGDSIRSTQP